jgi:hypothetical protein
MPLSPYTVESPLTIGMPSMVTIVYGPSMPLMWMSPVLQMLQLSWGRTPFTTVSASKMLGVAFFWKNRGV